METHPIILYYYDTIVMWSLILFTVLVQGLGMGCVLPTGPGVRPELILELVCYISRVYVSYGDRLG